MSHLIFLILFALFTFSCGDDIKKPTEEQPDPDHNVSEDGTCQSVFAGESVEWPYNGYDCYSVEGLADRFNTVCEAKCPGQECEQPGTCQFSSTYCDEYGRWLCVNGDTLRKWPNTDPLVCVETKCGDRRIN